MVFVVYSVYLGANGYGSISHNRGRSLQWLLHAWDCGDTEARALCRKLFPEEYKKKIAETQQDEQKLKKEEEEREKSNQPIGLQ